MLTFDGETSQLRFVICLSSKLICQGEYSSYNLLSKTGLVEEYEEYYLSLITTQFDIIEFYVTFDTECVDSETSPIFLSSDYYEFILPPISK